MLKMMPRFCVVFYAPLSMILRDQLSVEKSISDCPRRERLMRRAVYLACCVFSTSIILRVVFVCFFVSTSAPGEAIRHRWLTHSQMIRMPNLEAELGYILDNYQTSPFI